MRFHLLLSVAVSTLALGACGLMEQGSKADSSESLLDAQGSWSMVEEDRQPIADLHKEARDGVHIDDMSRHLAYAKKLRSDHKKDTNFRLLRLERQMSDVNRTLEKALPGFTAREYDSYAALGLPEPAVTKGKAKQAHKDAMKADKPAKAKKASRPSPSMAGPAAVQRVRIGDHPGKTRLVLDLNKPSHFSYDLDNQENLLLIDVSGAGWNAAEKKKIGKHPLIASYSAHDNGNGGTMLVVELKKSVKVLKTMALKPNAPGGYHRIVVDIAG